MASWNGSEEIVTVSSAHDEYIEVYLSGGDFVITFQVGRRPTWWRGRIKEIALRIRKKKRRRERGMKNGLFKSIRKGVMQGYSNIWRCFRKRFNAASQISLIEKKTNLKQNGIPKNVTTCQFLFFFFWLYRPIVRKWIQLRIINI